MSTGKTPSKRSGKKLPVDRSLYERWLPDFKDGIIASKEEADPGFGDRPRRERVEVKRRVSAGENAFMQIYDRVIILADHIIRREMSKPRSFHTIIEHDDLESAAYEGVYDALCKMDMDKMRSPTNYVLQWVDTKVTRAALKMEASTGLSPSKLRLYKKIAAVRRAMKADTGRDPSDEEVLDYFHSGRADFRSVNGRVGSNRSNFKSNSRIRLNDIVEQGKWDQGYNLHTPVTDTYRIDAEVHHDDGPAHEEAESGETSERFWRGYMDFIGIAPGDQDVIIDELQLFPIEPTDSDEKTRRTMGRDFIHLIQHPRGRIAEYSRSFSRPHGDGFWRAFSEDMTAQDPAATGRRRRKTLKLTMLKLRRK